MKYSSTRFKHLVCTLCMLILAFSVCVPSHASKKTLSISSEEEFLQFSEQCILDRYSENLFVTLTCDLDLSGTAFSGIPIFSGHFDGQDHTVRGLNLANEGSTLGFFRYLTETALVENLHLEGLVLPQGSRSTIGAIAGQNSGYIKNCSFHGTLSGNEHIGGITGINTVTGVLERCSVEGNVYGSHFVGGLAGENYGIIRHSSNSAIVNTTPQQNSVEISDITLNTLTGSESANTVTDIGGITGINGGVIRSCRNYGDIGYAQMGYNIGGIAGSHTGYILTCLNFGDVSGRKEVGGIVGQMEPVSKFEYSADTLQILEEQLHTMSALTNRASSNAQAQANELSSQITVLRDQTSASAEAVSHLISAMENAQYETPDGDASDFEDIDWDEFDPNDTDLTMPELDMDEIWAAENNLSSRLQDMNGTLDALSNSTREAGSSLSKDIDAISRQADAISNTLNSAEESIGATIRDASDEDTEQDTTGKVDNCSNSGIVTADAGSGGIVGAIAPANDLTHDTNIEVEGSSSLNVRSDLRAVIVNCENKGIVVAKKQYAGGIVGWQTMGLVKHCLNTGELNAIDAEYVGGIAGNSSGFIRENESIGRISGHIYVGGIAGLGSIVTGNRSMVYLEDASEKQGAILGFFSEPLTTEFSTDDLAGETATHDDVVSADSEPLSDNYYPVLDKDPGAIDGISYSGSAEGISFKEFLSLDSLSDAFHTVTVTFLFEDGKKEIVVLDSGERLTEKDIPSIPVSNGTTAYWEGIHTDPIYFDTVFALNSTSFRTTIMSQETRQNGLPVLLAQGSFSPDSTLLIAECVSGPEISSREHLLETWNLEFSGTYQLESFRYQIPDKDAADRLRIMICSADGVWTTIDCVPDGSFLVFPAGTDVTTFAVIQTQSIASILLILAAFGILLLAGVSAFLYLRKRKQK